MIKFKNKQGKKVMEMTDNGETKILDKDLKESFDKEDKKQLKETDK